MNRRVVIWRTSSRAFEIGDDPLLMAVINVTPDSFSDGGRYYDVDSALEGAERALESGADILDVGGESTRPGAVRVSIDVEIDRVVPVVEALTARFDAPVSIDTSKSEVARKALEAGAEIVNDVSGLKFDPRLGSIAAEYGAGIVLMHLRGSFGNVHSLEPPENIMDAVFEGLDESIANAGSAGIEAENICIDPGIGFGKSFEQNLELIANLKLIRKKYPRFALMIGTSRKSFIGKILGDDGPDGRLSGTLAANAVAVWNGANILRVHDIKEHREMLAVVNAIRKHGKN